MPELNAWGGVALALVVVAGSLLVIGRDWRIGLLALLIEYVAAAVLIAPLVLLAVVAVKLLVGLLVVAILTLTAWQVDFGRPGADGTSAWRRRFDVPTGFAFRVMATLMMAVAATYLANQPGLALPGLDQYPSVNVAAYVLMALGLLNLGLTEEPINAGLGLLSLLMGFELFYAALEPALAVVALLAAVQLGIAIAVSYLAMLQYSAPESPAA
ncbi:MAG: hypothetical protein ABI847_04165 [Anaerolineales bacterium]